MQTTTYRHADLNTVVRADVLTAIAECDRVGTHAFLELHGYRPSLLYQLRFKGRSYPSKAILGVAAGLSSQEFFGGAVHVVRHLLRLGFQVRQGRRVVTSIGLLDMARGAAGPATFEIPNFDHEPVAYFASGSNRPAEIRGLAAVGQDVGVAAPEIRAASLRELQALAGTDVQVFVDSGAFSEMSFSTGVPVVVAPIDEMEWLRRLELYSKIAKSLGSSAWLVAPDRVGDQDVTLRRLRRHRDALRDLAITGARILVPIQRGALSQAAFHAKVAEVLEGIAWLPAIPSKKAATSAEEFAAYVAAVKPRHVHLLGLGPLSSRAAAFLTIAADAGATVSMDSNWIKANVGKAHPDKNGQGQLFGVLKRSKPYTWAQEIARELLARSDGVVTAVRELALMIVFGIASVLCTDEGEED